MNATDIRERIDAQPYWYHRIELPDGVTTPGWAPMSMESYRIPEDLTGKRVLDIGAWDGFWSFEALRRGARQVVAIDDFSDYLGKPEMTGHRAWETFDICRDAFGYDEERCKRIEMSVYDLNEGDLGRFDVVLCFGVLYHLRYPLLALDFMSLVCDEEIFVESAILDDYSPYRGGLGHGYAGQQMVAEFYPNQEYGQNDTNWWVPNLFCLMHMIHSAGFEEVEAWKLAESPELLSQCRGFAHGRKPQAGNATEAHAATIETIEPPTGGVAVSSPWDGAS